RGGREQPLPHQLPRTLRDHDLGWRRVRHLVLRARDEDAPWATSLVAELVAHLESNALGLALEFGVEDFDTLLGHFGSAQVASSLGLGLALGCRRRRRNRRVVLSALVEVLCQRVQLSLRLGEL